MYTLEQLKNSELAELQSIATEMGIANVDNMSHDDIAYAIIDTQADTAAAKENEKTTKKRTRVSVKNVDRVYTASQKKAKKVDKKMQVALDDTLFGALTKEEKDMLTPVAEAPKTEEAPAPKKRGRKKKSEIEAEQNAAKEQETAVATENQEAAPAPKKRGRRKKSEIEAEEKAKAEALKAAEEEAAAIKIIEEEAETEAAAPSTEAEVNAPAEVNDVPEYLQDSIVPEASANFSEGTHTTITLGSAEPEKFTEPTDGSDFIIIKDVEPLAAIVQELYPETAAYSNSKGSYYDQEPHSNDAYTLDSQQMSRKPVEEEKPEEQYDFDGLVVASGVLEIQDNGGFLRSSDYNYLPSPDDIYVSHQQIKHWGLKNGDVVEGFIRPPYDGERWFILTDIQLINGCNPQSIRDRISFEFLTPLFPDQKFNLCKGFGDTTSSRIVDLFSPIGKGQRALIVAQPKTGKTLLMKDIANSISRNHPEAYLMMLLIDERPEEVTDMARTVNAEVIASTFDAPAENHVRIAGIVLEKAKRMVECGHDVVIFLDSITRLARAYNTVSPASGKVLSGGVDANALQKPKRFFGAARNIEGGGSLTIIATALIDTGSKMDEVIFEEFKGTGNMELQLDRSLANKRVFPAINLVASSTRRDDLLQDQTTLNRMWVLRKHIAEMTPLESMDTIMKHIEGTKNNEEFLISMNG